MRTRIKCCGMTRPDDALLAAQLGADAIGLIFYEKSPRFISITQAQLICDVLPSFVSKVGLFVNAKASEVERVLEQLPLDVLQFHGDEPPEFCSQFNKPFIKTLPIKVGVDFASFTRDYAVMQALLVDSFNPQAFGGTGQVFDWTKLPETLAKPLILAGGLNPENVAKAIQQVHPYAVDVCSGIESAPGLKDPVKMQRFITEVRHADSQR